MAAVLLTAAAMLVASDPVQARQQAAASVFPNDPGRPAQWALDVLNAELAWSEQTARGTVVAVLDTGVDASHPDLMGNVIPGFDALASTSGTADPNGHGTAVAGVIGATVGNGVGIAGMAPEVTILPIRVLDESRMGTAGDVERALQYAMAQGADVINLSFGSTQPAPNIRSAIDDATLAGAVVVASAGNSFAIGNAPRYPAADSDVIAVSAVDRDLHHAGFSTTHPSVDLAAPGVDVLMTAPGGGYVRDAGTSFAAPHVSATAALVKARYPRATAHQVTERVIESARDLPPAGIDDVSGHGLVQPSAALAWEPDAGCQIVDFDPLMRVWDDNRVETSAAAGCTFWPVGGAPHVVMATADSYADALSGTPLAARLDAPLLLTDPDAVPASVRQVLVQLGTREVTVIGGADAVSPTVASTLADLGIDVHRVAGADRYETAAAVARRVGDESRRVIVVTGRGFADAVAAGAYTARGAPPVLLTEPDAASPATLATISALQPEEILVVGGTRAVSADAFSQLQSVGTATVRRISGTDRYATSAAVLDDVDPPEGAPVVLATGARFPDALAAGAVTARVGGALLLVQPGQADRAADVIRAGSWSTAALLGGPAALSAAESTALAKSLDG